MKDKKYIIIILIKQGSIFNVILLGTFVNSILANLALDPSVELFVVSGRPDNVSQAFPYEEKWLKFDAQTREAIYKRVIGRTICVPVEKWQRLDKYVIW